jgi:GT2 family glycosyltransferase|tara:strand:+ start:3767 stop:4657 length:891 start_codon:yes stop_codon:yes gene_type:complete
MTKITHCISSFNNLNYLKLAVKSVRENSFYKDSLLIIHAENCQDGTDEWLVENQEEYNFKYYIEKNEIPRGIGGGMNFCASKVQTEFINFLHADFYVAKNWDMELLKKFEKYPNQRMIVFSHRIQPNIFKEDSRSGTLIVPMDEFGEYHYNFNEKYFLDWADEFSKINDFEIRKSEGVSGLIRKKDWDYIGGNDDRFAPAYWEDADLFIRMINENYKFVLTSKSVVFHFASRASRFPDDNLTTRPANLAEIEQKSTQRFAEKYGRLPERDEHDFYIPLQIIDGTPNRINQLKTNEA